MTGIARRVPLKPLAYADRVKDRLAGVRVSHNSRVCLEEFIRDVVLLYSFFLFSLSLCARGSWESDPIENGSGRRQASARPFSRYSEHPAEEPTGEIRKEREQRSFRFA